MHQLRLFAAAALVAALAALPAQAASPQQLEQRAQAAEQAGHKDQASVLYQAAVVADPSRAQSYVALAEFYARHGENHFAHKYFAEALYLNPKLVPALAGAGKADLALGDRAAAADALARLRHLCGSKCPQEQELASAMASQPAAPGGEQKASLDKR